jgi:hypothetical protein
MVFIFMKNIEANFLKDKYWSRPEFRNAAEKSARKKNRLQPESEEKTSLKPKEAIPEYLSRMEKILERKGGLFREKSLYPKYIIKPENISDEYIKGVLLGNFAEQQGYDRDDLKNDEVKKLVLAQFSEKTGHDFENFSVPENQKEEVKTMAVNDQKSRLNAWLDYLASPEAKNYPAAFRYWAGAEMLKLGDYDPARQSYNKRTETTVANFPELDQQALARVFDEINRKHSGEPPAIKLEDKERQAEFKKLLQSENFGDLYAFALDYVNSLRLPSERLVITAGEWRKFPRGSAGFKLAGPLQGFNTKWCIAGEGTAAGYLTNSDMHIYFSQDADGKNTIPRACIVDSKDGGITEVRGIISEENAKQHLDDYITPVVDAKLKTLEGGEKWQKNINQMKKLANLHLKHLNKEPFNKDDLIFIYEIDEPIAGTGYGRDPRINEIRKTRNPKEDAPVVLECAPEEITWKSEDISEKTKAYIGALMPGIFEKLEKYNIEKIYISFPEEKIEKFEAKLGGRKEAEIISELEKGEIAEGEERIYIGSYAKSMLKNKDFLTLKNKEQIQFVKLKVRDLAPEFLNGATTEQIYKKAEELGLELCPPETGPTIRLDYGKIFKKDQPRGEHLAIAMKQISDSDGSPFVFYVERNVDGKRWLYHSWAEPSSVRNPDRGFVFRFRKFDSFKS